MTSLKKLKMTVKWAGLTAIVLSSALCVSGALSLAHAPGSAVGWFCLLTGFIEAGFCILVGILIGPALDSGDG